MLNFFKKKKQIDERDYELLSKVVKSLPLKYSYLHEQVSKDFILDKEINELGDKGTFTLMLNANLEHKYADKSLPHFFILRDIFVRNKMNNSFEYMELHIVEGMLSGYRVQEKIANLDLSEIDTSIIKEKRFDNNEQEEVVKLLGELPPDLSAHFEFDSTFKIEYENRAFYVIKDFGDGNYLSIEDKGGIYGLIHDPFEIELLFASKDDFFEAIISGQFKPQLYIESKMR